MKWGWTTSSNNLESVLPLQNIFNNYFYLFLFIIEKFSLIAFRPTSFGFAKKKNDK